MSSLVQDRDVSTDGSDTRIVGTLSKLYIAHSLSLVPTHPWLQLLDSEARRFVLPPWFAAQPTRLGFELDTEDLPDGPAHRRTIDIFPQTIRFANKAKGETIVIQLERYRIWLCASVCILPSSHLAHSPRYVSRLSDLKRLPFPRAFEEESLSDGSHPSSLQHCVRFWTDGSKSFGDSDRTVRLTCTRWPTADSYCLDIIIEGRVYAPQSAPRWAHGPPHKPVTRHMSVLGPKAQMLGKPRHSLTHISLRQKRRTRAMDAVTAAYVEKRPSTPLEMTFLQPGPSNPRPVQGPSSERLPTTPRTGGSGVPVPGFYPWL
ncbi:hypothetical protein TRAPUB_14271 [Trametes pubescens]|uniref:Uncharacterized protein n=1 Tax=Trametes pubescens TaxID=154538 RepID=A0A1M2VNU7_TRAPU|nr:hypothetical protein TRAPUB_14271 [Trametes pubescens]